MAVKYQDYYKTLGVSRDASQEEIQRAYRKLARAYHPDLNKGPDAERKFKEINEAHEVLKDPEKRKRYDTLGSNWQSGDDFRPPPGWEEFSSAGGFGFRGGGQRSARSGGFGRIFEGGEETFFGGFSDFFRTLFGGGDDEQSVGARGWTQPGEDHEADVTIPLEDAYAGGKKTLTLTQNVTDANGRISTTKRSYEVQIPPGVQDGKRLRLPGQGGERSGKRGDLYLKMRIAPHPQFRIDGADLETDLPITPWEAALGGKVGVPLVRGAAEITIPAGTQSGKRFRLRGKGLARTGNERGDLYAVARIVVPERLSEKERSLLEQLRDASSFEPRGGGR